MEYGRKDSQPGEIHRGSEVKKRGTNSLGATSKLLCTKRKKSAERKSVERTQGNNLGKKKKKKGVHRFLSASSDQERRKQTARKPREDLRQSNLGKGVSGDAKGEGLLDRRKRELLGRTPGTIGAKATSCSQRKTESEDLKVHRKRNIR